MTECNFTPTQGANIVVGGAYANLRDSASTNGNLVWQMPQFTVMTVTGAAVSNNGYQWYPMSGNGQSGWVAWLKQDLTGPAETSGANNYWWNITRFKNSPASPWWGTVSPTYIYFAQVQYAITDLGTDCINGCGINDNGQVVGSAYNSSGHSHAFLWQSSSGMQDLGTLGGVYSAAYAINNSGQVVGDAGTSGDATAHAFLWQSGVGMQDLGTLGAPYDYMSSAGGINNSGQVAGFAVSYGWIVSSCFCHAFLWQSGSGMQDLGDIGALGSAAVSGINNSGSVVGRSGYSTWHAFLWQSGSGMQDLGSLPGGVGGAARGINDGGQVVGYAYNSSGYCHAFLWQSGSGMQDLGTFGGRYSQAIGINNSGQVVGYADTSNAEHAFLYSGSGPMHDLNTLIAPSSGWTLFSATAINNKGQIVGYGTNPAGQTHAFLLSPLSTIVTTTGSPPNTPGNALKPVNPTMTPPSGNLKRWDGQSWQSVTNWNDPNIHTNQPTVVIAHGWYGQIDGTKNAPTQMSSLADALQQQDENANILGWDWRDEALSLPGSPDMPRMTEIQNIGLEGAAESARRGGERQGKFLANELAGLHISNNNLQLIGHSNGGAVVGQAASILSEGGQKVARITTLDTPNLSLGEIPAAAVWYPIHPVEIDPELLSTSVNAMKYVKADSVSQVEVYYSGLEAGRNAFGFGAPLLASSGNNRFNGMIYPGHVTDPTDWQHQWDHLRIIDWYWGKDRTPQSPGPGQFIAGIDWSILSPDAGSFTAGTYAEQSFNSGVFGPLTLTQKQPVTLNKLWWDGFDTGSAPIRNWLGQHAQIFMRDVGNFAAKIISGSDGYLWQDVSIPQDASYLTFDLKVETPVAGDFLTVSLGNQVVYYKSLNSTNSDFWTVDPIFIGDFAGQTNTLLFTLNHVGGGTSSILLDNITFSTTLDYSYTTTNGMITITAYTGFGGAATIPSTINGLPVTSIGTNAFQNCTNLTSVTIPTSVTSIGSSAFDSCTSLTGVYFKGNALSVSNDASVFSGDANATVYYLPGTTGWGTNFDGRLTVLWNPQAQNLGVRTNQFGFTITGTPNIPIVVETCANLSSPVWISLQSCTLTNGSVYFSDSQWTNYPGRFYRLRSP